MNIWNNIRLFFSSLFQGLASADDIIQGQATDDGSKTIGIHQVKDIHRVAPALLRGEVTKEVAELRYRDYLVSEKSRQIDNEEDKDNVKVNVLRNIAQNWKFTAVNHEICAGITESSLYTQSSYTLNFKYKDSVKFLLEKYCDNFSIDDCTVTLRFNSYPNKNVVTSKAFCNYLNKVFSDLVSEKESEYFRINEMSFVTYKISSVPNYLKFIFKNLLLTQMYFDDKKYECVMIYKAQNFIVENLIEKFRVEDLEQKYANKEEKHIQQGDEIIDVKNLVCEVCGSSLFSESEGRMNRDLCGKFCCTQCCCDELIKKENLKDRKNENSD